MVQERAIKKEKSILLKRAKRTEETKNPERAKVNKKTIRIKRAREGAETKGGERVPPL